jgi:hypothetical protein
VFSATAANLNVRGNSTTTINAIRSSTDATGPNIIMRKARGTSASQTAVTTGDNMGTLVFSAFGGTNNRNIATIASNVELFVSDSLLSSNLTFSTASASSTPTEVMRIDSTGKVGIGTASPSYKLEVIGDIRLGSGGDLRIGSSTGTTTSGGDSQIYSDANNMIFATGTTSAERMRIDSSGNVGIGTTSPGSLLQLNKASGAADLRLSVGGTLYSNIYASSSDVNILSITAIPLILGTDNTERARINSVGHFLINETSASAASLQHNFEVNGDIMSNGSAAGLFWANRSTAPSSGANWYGWYTTGGTIYIYNAAAGNIASINPSTGAYTALSDAAKKKDFEPSNVGLDAVKALKPTLFRMATDAADAPKQLGFVAQEVKDHIPQAYVEEQNTDVGGNESTYIGLNDRPIIAALVKAVQELEARVAELEGK